MSRWFQFFLGTPKRFLWTMIGLGVIICAIDPSILVNALRNLRNAVLTGLGPLLELVLAIIVVFAGIKMILGKK